MSCSLQSCNVVHVRVDKTSSVNLGKSEAPAFQTRHLTSSLWSFATMGRPAPYVCIHSEFFALQGFGSLLGSAFGDLEVYGGKIGVEESTVDINLCSWLITFVHLCLVVFWIFFTKQKKALPRNMGEVGFLCAIASACGRSMFNKRFVHVHAILQNVFGITASWFRAAWFRAGLCVELGVDRLCTWKFYGSSSKPKIALPEILRFLEMQGTSLHHNLPLISTHLHSSIVPSARVVFSTTQCKPLCSLSWHRSPPAHFCTTIPKRPFFGKLTRWWALKIWSVSHSLSVLKGFFVYTFRFAQTASAKKQP